jgi:hypothetical protein
LLGVSLLAAACTPLDDPDDVYDDGITAEVEQALPDRSSRTLDESLPTRGDPWSCVQGNSPPVPPPEERPETVK